MIIPVGSVSLALTDPLNTASYWLDVHYKCHATRVLYSSKALNLQGPQILSASVLIDKTDELVYRNLSLIRFTDIQSGAIIT